MKLSEITNEDGRACANLINLLKAGRWDLTGNEAEQLVAVKKWVHDLAMQMAGHLQARPANTPAPIAPAPVQGFKVKSIKKKK